MAKKKKAGRDGKKSGAIREYLLKNLDATPKQVVAELAAAGVEVNPALVSNVKNQLKNKGTVPAAKRGRKPAAAATGSITVDQLIEAKKLVDAIGGLEVTKKALEALSKLS